VGCEWVGREVWCGVVWGFSLPAQQAFRARANMPPQFAHLIQGLLEQHGVHQGFCVGLHLARDAGLAHAVQLLLIEEHLHLFVRDKVGEDVRKVHPVPALDAGATQAPPQPLAPAPLAIPRDLTKHLPPGLHHIHKGRRAGTQTQLGSRRTADASAAHGCRCSREHV
jgi:hypothetical protein